MESIEIEGASIEEALERACDALNTNHENLEYEVLETEGRGSKKIKIVARKREGETDQSSLGEFALKSKEILTGIVKRIDSEYAVVAYEYPDKVLLNIKGDGSGLLIGKRGQTLDAIQHVVSKIIQKSFDRTTGKKIVIDTEKYREKRIDYLKELAKKLAEKVIRSGRPFTVNPMSSFERRIIHMSLDGIDGVTTESVGEGQERKVVILPQNSKKKGSARIKN